MEVDWAEGLPSELMFLIFERMETFDQARFTCVCTRWLSLGRQARLRRPPALPWMMLPPVNDGISGRGMCTFFGFPSPGIEQVRKTCRISLPQFIWKRCIATSPDGWLVVLGKNRELCVVNPLTRGRLPLPPIATIPEITLRLRCVPTAKDYSVFIYRYFKKALMFEFPPHGLVVAAIVDSRLHWLVVAKVGGVSWKAVHLPLCFDDDDYVEDIAFHGGKVFGATQDGKILACDLAEVLSGHPGTVVYDVLDRPPEMLHQHLVTFLTPPPSSSTMRAGLVVIYRYGGTGYEEEDDGPLPIHVMRLEQISDSAFRCFDDVTNLGGNAIFLDDWCCCMAIPADRALPLVKENLVYNARLAEHICRLDVLNLESEILESHRLSTAEGNYHPPSIWFWPAPQF